MATPSENPIGERQESSVQEDIIKLGHLLVRIVEKHERQSLDGQDIHFVALLQNKTTDIGIFVPRLTSIDIVFSICSVERGSLSIDIEMILPKNKLFRYIIISLAVGYGTVVLYPQFRAGLEMLYADVYNIAAIASRKFHEMTNLVIEDLEIVAREEPKKMYHQYKKYIIEARNKRDFEQVETFRDSGDAPEIVVVPAGSFVMGAPTDSQHEVTIAQRFAVGCYPVTFEEYDRFAEATDREKPDDRSWGRGRRPVINVSWEDAQAYVAWLSEQTGQPYRLLSEAEWEYACRAGTTTLYWWGDDPPTPEQANFGGHVGKTTDVGSYPPNPWGLHDMHGNVWEWVEDCWNDSYEGAPSDGSAWTSGYCGRRVLRGGSWVNLPELLRAAIRVWSIPDDRDHYVGFRVARTLR